MREHRTIPTEITLERRDSDKSGTITGYASVYYDGTARTQFRLGDHMVERIAPGAFDRAIAADDVRALFNHDPNQLLGRSSSGTLSLTSDQRGLRYAIQMGETRTHQDVGEMIERGDLQGSSFSFNVTDEDIFKDPEGLYVREVRGVELFDVGPVTFPAYSSTTTELRSVGTAGAVSRIIQWQSRIDRAADVRRIVLTVGGKR